MSILIAIATAAALSGSAAQAEKPAVTFSNIQYSRGCRTAIGPPQSTFSPDRRVVSIILQGLTAERRGASPRRDVRVSCRISLDAEAPAGMRAQFKAASYRFSLLAMGGGRAELSLRHGRKRFLGSRWSGRITRTMSPAPGERIAPGGPAITTGCGQKSTLLIDMELRASGTTSADEAVAEVDSIDIDGGVPEYVTVEPCR